MPVTKYSFPKRRVRLKRRRSKALLVPLLLGGLVLTLIVVWGGSYLTDSGAKPEVQVASEQAQTQQETPEPAAQKQVKAQDQDPEQPPERPANTPQAPVQVVEKTVHRGQTVTSMLAEYLNPADVYALCRQAKDVYPLRRIKAGQPYRLKVHKNQLQGFEYEIDAQRKLCVQIEQGNYEVFTKDIAYDVQTSIISGKIRSSLFTAVTSQDESPVLAMKLADIFAWDVDFIRDIREGDSFRLVVEKCFRNGEFTKYGPIVAAEFTNQDRTFQAFLFQTQNGRREYFTASGQAVRKTFLKAPLNFTRISSGYTWKRKHPVLDVVRPHLAIDYAARRGTPIKSVADGVVMTRAYAKGAGKYIKIRHPNSYVTVYNHMSRFASKVRRGTRVKQGQVIGYVGSTGLSTGPHLDYRVKKNGSYVNPLKIDSEPVEPVPAGEMDRFQRAIQPLQAALKGQNPFLAQADSETSASSNEHL